MTQTMSLFDSDALRFTIKAERATLDGTLVLPPEAQGVVIFAQGSGSSRLSPRNRVVARRLNEAGFATLLFNLLTLDEEVHDRPAHARRVDLDLLTVRLLAATDQLSVWPETSGLPLCYFSVGVGTAAALLATVERPGSIGAVVSWSGLPNLASAQLATVQTPTLLIVGGEDHEGITRNQAALPFLGNESALALIPGAGQLLDQPAAMEQAIQLSVRWYARFIGCPV